MGAAWEPADNCAGCVELVQQFEAATAALPPPLTRTALIAARKRLRTSLDGFARQLGVPAKELRQWEAGDVPLPASAGRRARVLYRRWCRERMLRAGGLSRCTLQPETRDDALTGCTPSRLRR